MLYPLVLLIVNDVLNGLKSENKFFVNTTSLLSIALNVNTAASDLTKELELIRNWVFL